MSEFLMWVGGIVGVPMVVGAFFMRNVKYTRQYSMAAQCLSAWLIGTFVCALMLIAILLMIKYR